MSEDGYNNISIPGQCTIGSQLLHSSQGKWAKGSAVATETRVCAEPREVPVRTHARIYTLGLGIQHTEYDLVTCPGQGPPNKGPGSQSGLLPPM